MSASVQEQIVAELESQRLAWVRRRFLLFAIVVSVLCTGGFYPLIASSTPVAAPAIMVTLATIAPVTVGLQCLLAIGCALLVATGHGPVTIRGYLRLAAGLVAACMFLMVPLSLHLREALQQLILTAGGETRIGFGVPMLLFTLLLHLVACLIIPWRPLESLLPIAPILLVYFTLSGVELLQGRSDLSIFAVLLITVLIVIAPGVLVCAIRSAWFSTRFQSRAYMERYHEIAAELDLARRIHERLFPAPITDGEVRASFEYVPMRSIGGDFLFLRRPTTGSDSPVHLVLIDVTGHGIAAALAVNRLHGELERIFGAEHDPAPGIVLKGLNQYVELTMARDSMYATAIVMRIDPTARELRWASASHPPAFIAGSADSRDLASTAVILGALPDAEFESDEQATPFLPGERVVAYTDGAFEIQLAQGGMLGLAAFRRIAIQAAREPAWAESLRTQINDRRAGAPADDLLIVQVGYAQTPLPAE